MSDSVIFLEHHGVKGMRWGVRRRQEKSENFAKKAKAARDEGRNFKANRLDSKSQSFIKGTPEFAARQRRNKQLIVLGVAAIRATPLLLEVAGPSIQKAAMNVEKTRLSFVLRNDVRFDPANKDTANMIDKGMDFIKKSRGVYNITSL